MSDVLKTAYTLGLVFTKFPSTFKYPSHPLYQKYRYKINTIRDVLEGSDAVKANAEKYIPRLKSQDDTAFAAYVRRGNFVNSTARIHSTNVGTIVRRSPTVEHDSDMDNYFTNDSISVKTFSEVFKFTVSELVAAGRVACVIEVDEEHNTLVPVLLATENVINWSKDSLGNTKSVLLAIHETVVDTDTYESSTIMVYYSLYLDEEGVYTVKITNDSDNVEKIVQPSIHGNKIKFVPFTCANSFGLDIDPVKSPVTDVVDINISHFMTSCDLETGRHFVGLPQPIVTGASSEDKLMVGGDEAWVIPNEKAKAYYMEFLGQGLDGLARALSEKDSQMAQFSAQLMDTGSKGSEAEGTVRMRYSSDAANLSTIAESAELFLVKVYNDMAAWLKSGKVTIELNKDFISDKLTYNELREYTKTWYDGGLSDEEYRYVLRRGEVLPSDRVMSSKNTANSQEPKTTDEGEVK